MSQKGLSSGSGFGNRDPPTGRSPGHSPTRENGRRPDLVHRRVTTGLVPGVEEGSRRSYGTAERVIADVEGSVSPDEDHVSFVRPLTPSGSVLSSRLSPPPRRYCPRLRPTPTRRGKGRVATTKGFRDNEKREGEVLGLFRSKDL